MAAVAMSPKYQLIDEIGPNGRSHEQIDLLKRTYQGMEVRDAPANVVIHVTPDDLVGAVPSHLGDCVFAKTCRRMFNSGVLVFMATTAYLDMEDEDGVWRVFRFEVSMKMREAIKKFDEGGRPETGTYTLLAISPHRTLEAMRRHSSERRKKLTVDDKKRRYRKEKKRRALIKSKARKVKTVRRAGPLGILRSGTGLIQTTIG